MTCDDLREDLEAYALGALDGAHARQVAAHVAECRECSRILRAYQVAVDSLALSAPLYRAPPRVKDRIMGGIGAFPAPALSMMRRRWGVLSAAAVLVAFAIGGLTWAIVLSHQVSSLRADNARLEELTQLDEQQREALLDLEDRLNSARSEQLRMSTTLEEQATLVSVALDPDLEPTTLAGTSLAPNASCSYVWSSTQGVGALTCKDLPLTAYGLNYELWAIKGDRSVSLGSFPARIDGSASLLVKYPSYVEGRVTSLWVTLEEGGETNDRPSTQVVLQPVPALQANR